MDHLPNLVAEARAAIAAAGELASLDEVRVRYLGKKGEITALLKGLGKLSPEERPQAGERINQAKQQLSGELEARKHELEQAALNVRLAAERVDFTLQGLLHPRVVLHTVTRSLLRIA